MKARLRLNSYGSWASRYSLSILSKEGSGPLAPLADQQFCSSPASILNDLRLLLLPIRDQLNLKTFAIVDRNYSEMCASRQEVAW